nr:hypothetical protein [Tanacetum cinerariifolium]
MDQQYPTVAKIPILDTGKFEQWQFWIQQYLQHEHYALWEVIEFGDSYEVPTNTSNTTTIDKTSDETGMKSGRTVTLTAEDMQKKKNDVKARTTLLLSLPDEHQLRFSKYKTTRELWAAILKTFGGNEATKKTKKNLLKQQYGNFRAEGSKTLEQTFSRLQVIIGQLQFMDIEVEQDDLNQKFLTSLALEWLMHTILWRNRSDLDTMILDDLYNHLKVNESEVQKKSEQNSQNIAFISSAKHSSRNKDGNTACVPIANTNVPTASASVATTSQDTACAYIASQSSGSQIKFEDINQIDEDDMEEMDIKWNMALLSMRADKFWKRTGAPRSQDRGRRDNFKQGSKAEEQALKALMAIDRVGWDWSYMANDGEDHALVTDEEAPIEFALMANTSTDNKVFDNSLCSKDCKKNNDSLNSLLTALKDLDNLIKSQGSDKNKEGLGYTAVPPPPVQLYLSPQKDLSWTGLPECADDTVTDFSRPSPTVESTSKEDQNRIPSVSKNVASPITPKPFIKFMKPKDSQSKSPDFVMKKKACFNCGNFNHLAYDCRKRVKKNFTPRPVVDRPYRPSQRPVRTNMNGASPNRTSLNKPAHSYGNRPFHRTSAVRSPYRPLWVPTINRYFLPVNRKFSTGSRNFPTANRKFPTASRKFPTGRTKSPTADMEMKGKSVKPSACNISYLSDYEPFNRGYVSFGQGGCKITGKWTIKTGKLEFKNVYFVKDL